MSETDYPEFDPQLELKDRINYPHILTTTIIAIKSVLRMSDEFNMRKVQVMILDLLTDIPETWKDEQFEKDLKKVVSVKTVDTRPMNAGVKLSKERCKALGIASTREVKEINYFKLKNVLVNLLDRRHMLIRKEKIEYSSGRNLDFESIEDLDVEDEDE